MPFLYSKYNKRNIFSQPQFTIRNHRFRGPRESEKINLEIGQLVFSVRKLYEDLGGFFDDFKESISTCISGKVFVDIDYDSEDASMPGLDGLVADLYSLESRIERLERLNAS